MNDLNKFCQHPTNRIEAKYLAIPVSQVLLDIPHNEKRHTFNSSAQRGFLFYARLGRQI